MSYLPENGYKRVAVLFMYAVIGYFLLRYLLPLVLPFLVAWVIALVLQPLVGVVAKAAKIPTKGAAVAVLVLVLGGVGFVIYLGAGRVASEVDGVMGYIGGWVDTASSRLGDIAGAVAGKLDLPESIMSAYDGQAEFVGGIVRKLTGDIAAGLSAKLPEAVSVLPGGVFFVVITVVAAFYITSDFDAINSRLLKLLPVSAAAWLCGCGERLRCAGISWIRAYLWLMAVTFAQLFCGFLILGVDYAFTIALLCAFADLLPVIGVGTILIPWAVVLLIGGSYYQGVGLLIIWGVTALVRQIIEPRIVGGSLGLDPLVTLIAMYAGFKLAGIWGIVAAPVLALLVCGVRRRDG